MILAIENLEKLLEVGVITGEIRAQAGAALNLGMLYHKQGNHKKAVDFLEQHFELVRQVGDFALIDEARVNLGIARANCTINSYVAFINSDYMDELLSWKNKRTPFN